MNRSAHSFFLVRLMLRYYHTLKHLRWEQLFYRLYYPFKRTVYRFAGPEESHITAAREFPLVNFLHIGLYEGSLIIDKQEFRFLNASVVFNESIDWEYRSNGLLWLFNLHYFDWLETPEMPQEKALDFINQFIDNYRYRGIFIHSYPVSLRIKNWIRYFVNHGIHPDDRVLGSLFGQADYLCHFPEYEIMGNHLLQNGIALVWAGAYFDHPTFLAKGSLICTQELERQILEDGAHFEKSLLYHSHLMKDLLELVHFLSHKEIDIDLTNKLIISIYKLFSFYEKMVLPNDLAPHFGDSNEASLVPGDLLFRLLNTYVRGDNDIPDLPLSASGYRVTEREEIKLYFNTGNIPASCQPGHTHADAFSFCLFVDQKPIVVDPGVSTYMAGVRRSWERSTVAHNTLSVNGEDSIGVWKSFRVAERIRTINLSNSSNFIDYKHDGFYKKYKIYHVRSIHWEEDDLYVRDRIEGHTNEEIFYHIHFHPSCQVIQDKNLFKVVNCGIIIELNGVDAFLENYDYAEGFGRVVQAKRIRGTVIATEILAIIKRYI